MAIAVGAPTGERGQLNPDGAGLIGWTQLTGTFSDDREYVPELVWPNSVLTYDRMMTDAQVQGLMLGTTLPIRRYRWMIDPNGARPELVDKLRLDLGLPVKGDDEGVQQRRKGRFNFASHLEDALRALQYGHYVFEQVGEIGDDGMWHLKKLAPRAPRTIDQIDVEKDGMVRGIKQSVGPQSPEIPMDRLVWYAWNMEAGNWVGTSMLRSCFRDWLVKDRLMRVDAVGHERNAVSFRRYGWDGSSG